MIIPNLFLFTITSHRKYLCIYAKIFQYNTAFFNIAKFPFNITIKETLYMLEYYNEKPSIKKK